MFSMWKGIAGLVRFVLSAFKRDVPSQIDRPPSAESQQLPAEDPPTLIQGEGPSGTSYPEQFLRGIPNKEYVDEAGFPLANLFQFEITNPERTDEYKEESINWRDSDGALTILFNQKKENGTIQFKNGAAVLLVSEIEKIAKNNLINNRLSYERRTVPGNDYHGNLLLHNSVPKQIKKKLAAAIALSTIEVIPNPQVTQTQ